MSQDSTPRTRSRVTGCAVAAAATVVAVIAAALWMAFAVSSFLDEPEIPAPEKLGKQVGLTEYRLQQALSDGKVTDQEIAKAAGGPWTVTRNDAGTRVVVGYEPGPACYQFELPPSPGPTATVRRSPVDHCPALINKPE
ncbi:hypothetical protein [Streptomyces sp. ITFR-16]|uniref:hypothetical protein n=1 Tax=Streptomyces sp. ITFR-16 TaxID=3075198 RepID=UPI00288C19F3|nr:hypothetical protein [Streptomyces sp. ITFR-16]WNI22735.1 hypothetical protein RLT58_12730 [Streptomyces sp. ITFR-16]